jgi:WD40 repeat protein/serine/threonine protein kinase
MVDGPSGSTDRDRQVNEIITAYLQAVDAGQTPDRQEWLRQYPEYAAELQAFLADYERVDRMAEPLRPAEKGTGPICRNGPEAGTDAQRWSSHQSDLSAFPPNEAATVDSGQPVPVGAGTTIRYFGDYELLEEIGRGGMGVVYKARQVSLNRVVALKMILAGQLASESDVRRFHTEAEAAAQLDHPGIVPIFEVGQHEGQHYFSMGYVEGQSLAVRVAAGPLPPREAAEVVQSVAEAVEYAHQKGVLHRDLKPANVLLDESRERRAESSEPARIGSARPGGSPLSALGSRPRITDFGLAKRMTAEAGPTTTGQILGTPSYMPPEQASGRLDEVGPASDVYGLGAVLYTLVTGRPPFQSANPLDTLRQVREAEPAAPRLLNAGIDRDLETIILKCLAKEPAGRYATARELSDDLARFLSGQTIRARPVGRSQRLWRWCRRNPVVAGLTAAVAVVLLAGAATSTFFALQANRRAGDAVREKDRADAKADEATANAREARQRLYISDMRLAQRAWEEGHLERLTELLDAHQPRHEQDADLRAFEWHYWQRLARFSLLTLTGHTEDIAGIAFSPDGKLLASAGGEVRVWDAASGQEIAVFRPSEDGPNAEANKRQPHPVCMRLCRENSENVTSVAFSPDSRRIAAGVGLTIKVWDLATRQPITLKGHKYEVQAVAFSPDGTWLASGGTAADPGHGEPGELKIWDAVKGQFAYDLVGHADAITCVAFSPDGKRLASGDWDNTLRTWDVAGRQPLLVLPKQPGRVTSVAFSPQGDRLVTAHDTGRVTVRDAASGRELSKFDADRDSVDCVAFSPGGHRLATASGLSGSPFVAKVWDAKEGRELLALKHHAFDGEHGSVAFSPDGKLLAAGSGTTVKVWDVAADPKPLACRGHRQEIASVAFSPDGTRLATVGSVDETLKVWDAIGGQEMVGLTADFGHGVAFSPDGKLLAAGQGQGVFVCDPLTGREIRRLAGHTGGVITVAFSPDGKLLASACRPGDEGDAGEIIIWDVADGTRAITIEDPFAWNVAFSPDGKRLASARWDEVLAVWDVADGKRLLTLRGHTNRVRGVAFSPDGQLIASASEDRTLRLWDAATGQEVAVLKGSAAWINGVAFSPDGKRLAAAEGGFLAPGGVRLWDVPSGQETMLFVEGTRDFQCVAFSPDGRRLAAGTDEKVLVWDARPLDEQRRLEQQAISFYRQVTDESWNREQVIERVRQAPAISEAARRLVLAWAERYPEDPAKLAKGSWDVARRAGQPAEAYQQALRWAESAVQKEAVNQQPGMITAIYMKCLAARGAAQYRTGQYRAALESLEEGGALWRAADEFARSALMAMSHQRLGETEKAQAILKQLRETAKKAKWAQDEDVQATLREVEAVVGNARP